MAFFDSKKKLLSELTKDANIASQLKDMFMAGQLEPDTNFEEILKNFENVIKRCKKNENPLDKVDEKDKPLLKLLMSVREKNNDRAWTFFSISNKNISKLLSQELTSAEKSYQKNQKDAASLEYKHLSENYQIDVAKHIAVRAKQNKLYTASELGSSSLRAEIVGAKNERDDRIKELQNRVKEERKKFNDKSLENYDSKDLEAAESELLIAQRGGLGVAGDKQELAHLYRKFRLERKPNETKITSRYDETSEQSAFPSDINTDSNELNQWEEFTNHILYLQQNPQKIKDLYEKKDEEKARIQKYHAQKKAAIEARHETLIDNLQEALERNGTKSGLTEVASVLSMEDILAGLATTNPRAASAAQQAMASAGRSFTSTSAPAASSEKPTVEAAAPAPAPASSVYAPKPTAAQSVYMEQRTAELEAQTAAIQANTAAIKEQIAAQKELDALKATSASAEKPTTAPTPITVPPRPIITGKPDAIKQDGMALSPHTIVNSEQNPNLMNKLGDFFKNTKITNLDGTALTTEQTSLFSSLIAQLQSSERNTAMGAGY